MQTFMPYPTFKESLACLDYKRLGNQRKETIQILEILLNKGKAWANHPAVLQWKNNIPALALYGIICCETWIDLGYKDTCLDKILNIMRKSNLKAAIVIPDFMGNDKFHVSHRSNLLRKDPEFHSRYGWTESDNLEYFWPSKDL